jgi:hypothetical protein
MYLKVHLYHITNISEISQFVLEILSNMIGKGQFTKILLIKYIHLYMCL